MYRTSRAFGAAFAAALFIGTIGAASQLVTDARASSCLPTDHIDGSTAAQTMQKMEAAGYIKPHDLRKGCDNYWYGRAMKGSAKVDVVLPPGGQPFTAHDS